MRITHLDVERYGLWSNMRLDGLSDGLNVVYGPNGSGKTTLMQFLRSVFYGLPSPTSTRFIPAFHEGRQGGTVGLIGPNGEFTVSRFADDNGEGAFIFDSDSSDAVTFEQMLIDIGEPAFQNLFTVGYQEADSFDVLIQEALTDKEDVVESEKQQEVARAQQRVAREKRMLLDDDSQARIQNLAEERDSLRAEIEQLRIQIAIPVDLKTLQSHLVEVETRIEQVEAQIASLDQAIHDYRAQPSLSNAVRCQPAIPESASIADDVADLDQQILKWRRRSREIDEDIVSAKQQLETLHVRNGQSQESTRVANIARTRDCVQQLKQQVRQLQTHTAAGSAMNGHSVSLHEEIQQLRNQVFELCRELGREEAQQRQRSLESEIVQLRRCQDEMRREIGILTARRDTLIRNYGLEDREFLRRAVTSLCACADEESYVPSLVERPFENVATKTDELNRMREERDSLLQQLNTHRADGQRLTIELRQLESEIADSTVERRIQRLQLDLNIVDENLRRAVQRWQTLSASEEILSQLANQYQDEHQFRILKEASAYLSQLTKGSYERIAPDSGGQSLVVKPSNGHPLTLNGLSRGTRDQVALSLRLAIASAYARRGHRLPIVLDDVFLTSDDDRAEAIAILLRDYAANGQQIVFLTCSEQHADLFRSIEVQVQTLPANVVAPPPTVAASNPVVVKPAAVPIETPPVASIPPATDSSLVIKAFAVEADELEDRVVSDLKIRSESGQSDHHESDGHWIFYLEVDSPIDELPGICPEDLEELASVGVTTVEDLLALVPDAAAMRLSHAGITPEQIRSWQSQAMLSCRIPMLRTRDAWLLVHCGLTNPEQISRMHPEELFASVDRFLKTKDGRQFVRKNNPFDLQTAINWIRWSRHTRNLWDSRESAPTGRSRSTASRAAFRRTDNGSNGSGNGNKEDGTPRIRGNDSVGNGTGDGDSKRSSANASDSYSRSGTTTRKGTGRKRTRAGKRSRRSSVSTESQSPLGQNRRHTDETERTGRSFTRQGLSGTGRPESSVGEAGTSSETEKSKWRYYLEKSSPVEDGPSIGPKTAERLARVGIYTVQDLLDANCEQIARTLKHRRIKAETLKTWQSQARLVCQIPRLRGHDAQILVACDVDDPETLATMRANDLFAIVMPFTETSEGERIIRNGKKPDLAEIKDWIEWASHARDLHAA